MTDELERRFKAENARLEAENARLREWASDKAVSAMCAILVGGSRERVVIEVLQKLKVDLLEQPAPAAPPQEPAEPVCPGPDCVLCNGEACDKCGAGMSNSDPNRPRCEHDVIERHNYERTDKEGK